MILAACILYGLIFRATPAEATLVTIEIEAAVDYVGDPYDYLEGKIKVGDIITGFYAYDSSTLDTNPSLSVGDYRQDSASFGISLTVGGFEFKSDPTNLDFIVEIISDSTSGGLHDGYGVLSGSNLALSNGTIVDQISWWLGDSSATALSSTDLPGAAPVLGAWQSNTLILGTARLYGIQAHVTSGVVIPEPTTILPLALGGLVFLRRNKKIR
jgi:hypothetical protein